MSTIYKITLSFVGIFMATALLAQGPPPATPIDGGLSILLAVGGAYGLKKLKDSRKKD
jgi:hypothetical protein